MTLSFNHTEKSLLHLYFDARKNHGCFSDLLTNLRKPRKMNYMMAEVDKSNFKSPRGKMPSGT
ncbi:rCG46531 [Rattus norvegicus]|uniref:RCG46531 n=1 Tax=Rattus norvegicus TaxID=10116 RepID=A6ICP6_RAT|nr:rCG46531 [Rattus norvegicus]